jgi:hypothetical protein
MRLQKKHKEIVNELVAQTTLVAKGVAHKHLEAHEDEFEKFLDEFLATIRRGILEFYAELRKITSAPAPKKVEVHVDVKHDVQSGHHKGNSPNIQINHPSHR